MVECTYNTSSATSFIRGGYSSQEEMCMVFMHYYPASNLAHCASRLSFQHVLLALGINVWPLTPSTRHLGLRIRDPWQYQNLTFSDYLKVAASTDTAVNLKLQEASLHHSHKADCFDYGRRRIYAVFYFDFKLPDCFDDFLISRMELSFQRQGFIIQSMKLPMDVSVETTFMTSTITG